MDWLFYLKRIFQNKSKIKYVELIPWIHSDLYKINENIEKFIFKLPNNSIIGIEITKDNLDLCLVNTNLRNLEFDEFIKIFDKQYQHNRQYKDENYYEFSALCRILSACFKKNHHIIPIENESYFLELHKKLNGIDELKDPIIYNSAVRELNPKREKAMTENILINLNKHNYKIYVIAGVSHIKSIKYNLNNLKNSEILLKCDINYNIFKSEKSIIKKKVKLECKKRIKNSLEEYIKLDREIAKLNFQLSRSNSFFKPDFESDYK